MCGIGGVVRVWKPGEAAPPPEVSIPEGWLDIIDEGIKHRGPDGHGRFRDRAVRADGSTVDVALVHRRLAIIDVADGQQPMVSERGRSEREGLVAVVFNGCIYNHRELRKELEAAGHRFVTDHSDTEVLVHGWREWGQGLFDRLTAMGALALWDHNRAALCFHRTAPGEKPLYIAGNEEEQITAFASVAAALLGLQCFTSHTPTHRASEALVRWIALGHGGYSTPLGGVELATYGTVQPAMWDYHDSSCDGFVEGSQLPAAAVTPWKRMSIEARVERVDHLLNAAVAARLEADVPLCCLLSGGVDSSLIAFYAKRFAGGLKTLCVRMPDPRYDESAFAEAVAAHLGTSHTTIAVGVNPADDLACLIRQIGLPFGDSSLLPTYWACRAAADYAKVLLTGDGGDELFYGYDRYKAAGKLLLARGVSKVFPATLLPRRDPRSKWDKLARFVTAARIGSYTSLLAIFQHPDLKRLVGDQARFMGWGISSSGTFSARNEDLAFNLESDMLSKLDTASMAIPVETRAPFLDQELIREMRNLTPAVAIARGERKGLLRAVARRFLPVEIIDRPKQGFAIPIGEWFRSDYGGMKTLLMDHLNSAEPWPGIGVELNRTFVAKMVEEHMGRVRDHSQRLYMLLVLSIWATGLRQGGTSSVPSPLDTEASQDGD